VSGVVCRHLDEVAVRALPATVDRCEDCLRDGGKWLHLGICLSCAHIGCCDDSRLAIIRSLEPGEDWSCCYLDEVAFRLDSITGTTRIPPSPWLG
jgi:hypothetical protein